MLETWLVENIIMCCKMEVPCGKLGPPLIFIYVYCILINNTTELGCLDITSIRLGIFL